MEIEYSNEVRGKVHAFRFTQFEKQTIVKALRPEISKRHREIDKLKNHPKNEGQVTYAVKIEELYREIKEIEAIRNAFT